MKNPWIWLKTLEPISAVIFAAVVVSIVVFFNPVSVVNPGQRGVLVWLGEVRPVALTEGPHLIWPFLEKVVLVDVTTKKYEHKGMSPDKEGQTVHTKVTVTYHIDYPVTPSVYQTYLGDVESRVVVPAVQGAVQEVTTKYSADQILEQWSTVVAGMVERIRTKLKKSNLVLDDAVIAELKFSDTLTQAIENKKKAEQDAFRAKNDKDRIQYESEQVVLAARAEAASLGLRKSVVSPELVALERIKMEQATRLRMVEKWDGKLPLVSGEATPMLDASWLAKGAKK